MPEDFQPVIIGFLCHWCAYQGSDAAGRARIGVFGNLREIRVMCSGRVDPQWVLDAFQKGADGVLILGCPWGSCHYKTGNLQAMKRVALMRQLLAPLGVAPERLVIDWVAADEGQKFAAVVGKMAAKLVAMGPLHLKDIHETA